MPVGGGACCPPPMPPFLSPAPLLLVPGCLVQRRCGPLQALNIGQPQQSPPAKFLVSDSSQEKLLRVYAPS
uniref:Uncharacterized protein n=1 Tax=Oryza barthii TaxID=65489 RepID=A0A0D3F425_9ORYZ